MFQINDNVGETEPVVKQLVSTVDAVREKTFNDIMIGLLPRLNVSHHALREAIGINNRLESTCKQNGVRFINLWNKFIGNIKLYQGDETHFNEQGKKAFGNHLNEHVFKLSQNANHRGCTSGLNSVNHTTTIEVWKQKKIRKALVVAQFNAQSI